MQQLIYLHSSPRDTHALTTPSCVNPPNVLFQASTSRSNQHGPRSSKVKYQEEWVGSNLKASANNKPFEKRTLTTNTTSQGIHIQEVSKYVIIL